MADLLQAATQLELVIAGRWARWTYRVTESMPIGRQKNELLAIGYMLNLARHFIGERWSPNRAELSGPKLKAQGAVETVFSCEIAFGDVAAILFPADLLELPNPKPVDPYNELRIVPAPDDFLSCVEHLILLGLLDGRPKIDWVGQRLGMFCRTLQRQLYDRTTTFDGMVVTY
jgi:hypothetical protein